MSDALNKFQSHAKPLADKLLDAFPNSVEPTYENVHNPDPNAPTPPEQIEALKEVVHYLVNEGLVRQSTVHNTHIVLSEKGYKWAGGDLSDLSLPAGPYDEWL